MPPALKAALDSFDAAFGTHGKVPSAANPVVRLSNGEPCGGCGNWIKRGQVAFIFSAGQPAVCRNVCAAKVVGVKPVTTIREVPDAGTFKVFVDKVVAEITPCDRTGKERGHPIIVPVERYEFARKVRGLAPVFVSELPTGARIFNLPPQRFRIFKAALAKAVQINSSQQVVDAPRARRRPKPQPVADRTPAALATHQGERFASFAALQQALKK